jgi:cobalt-zinc-cadmium efflux system membrane fusion protein
MNAWKQAISWILTLGTIAGVAAIVILKPRWGLFEAGEGVVAPEPTPVIVAQPALPAAPGAAHAELPVIKLSTPQTAARIGLVRGKVDARNWIEHVDGPAQVEYNANLFAEIRPRVPGFVSQVLTDIGRVHHKGDVLAVMDSAEVGAAKASYLAYLPLVELAQSTLDRTLALRKSDAVPLKEELVNRADLNRARADLLNARLRLKNLGFSDAEIEELKQSSDTSSLLKIVAPIDGTIVARHAVTGEVVEATHILFDLVDTRRMWLWIDVGEAAISSIAPDQPVKFVLTGIPDQVFTGKVERIDSAVTTATRTIRVRAELENPNGQLRAKQFGRATIETSPERSVLVVPRDAVQRTEVGPVVFVPLDAQTFQPRRVEARAIGTGEWIEIVQGLSAGDEVVTTGAFLLKSELVRVLESEAEGPGAGIKTHEGHAP